MGRYLNVGNEGFESVVRERYVDKTGLIQKTNRSLGTMSGFICVTRPHGSGKSYAAQMLCAYYDRSCDSRALFEGLEIAGSENFEKYLNKYNVFFINMAEFISLWGHERKGIVRRLEQQLCEELDMVYPEVKSCEFLAYKMLSVAQKEGRRFIFIIDEWDALYRMLPEETELQYEYMCWLRAVFKNGNFTARTVEMAYITGVLPMKKYGLQSTMTDFEEYTVVLSGVFDSYPGFLEKEVQLCLEGTNLEMEEVKRWCGGYQIGREQVFSPCAVMRAVSSGRFDDRGEEDECFRALKKCFDMDFESLPGAMYRLFTEPSIHVDARMFRNDLISFERGEEVLSLMIHLGYLGYDFRSDCAFIPNDWARKEILRALEDSKLSYIVHMLEESRNLLDATLAMDEDAVAKTVGAVHNLGKDDWRYNSSSSLREAIRLAYYNCFERFEQVHNLNSGRTGAGVVYRPGKDSGLPVVVIALRQEESESLPGQVNEEFDAKELAGISGKILLVDITYDEETRMHSCRIGNKGGE